MKNVMSYSEPLDGTIFDQMKEEVLRKFETGQVRQILNASM